MRTFLLLNGPNLNLLGTREPEKYGSATLEEIELQVQSCLSKYKINVECFQSNAEHLLIERIHSAKNEEINYILFNPAAFTHTSVALRDALLAVDIPFTEIHLTDPKSREPFRHHSFFSDIAKEVVSGLGAKGYLIAAENAAQAQIAATN
ncbi:type II 3-dehydroquinate dehydratase [Pleionea sediminis]|uniref:type II 3-dehydroquinate dehydratase n=1 Tax=Pleionea sediminis TaxID=2569479 RepID=UPI00118629BB|nr:type II 3-dehydroquinate dehydratase [Pleionea sediminis]